MLRSAYDPRLKELDSVWKVCGKQIWVQISYTFDSNNKVEV